MTGEKFSQYLYTRPEIAEYRRSFDALLAEFEEAPTAERQVELFAAIDRLRRSFDTQRTICQIRHTVNTADAFYEAENAYFDEVSPSAEEMNNRFYAAVLKARFRSALEAHAGQQFFVIADLALRTFKPEILGLLEEENKLRSEYVKLRAQAKLEFRGQTYNLSSIHPLEIAPDRDTRRDASAVKWKFFEENAEKTEAIYDRLVKVRHEMALALGYKNFIELGYARMLRSDYRAADVAVFRQQVLEHVVPLCAELKERQRQRIGVDKMLFYDEGFQYPGGNPAPKGPPEWIVEQAQQMYGELSAETDRFFRYMLDHELMDLLSKPNKAPGGYCTFLSDTGSPFIYSNFNGTSGDIDVLTHEAGHAFQTFESRDLRPSEYTFPTYEACEIHSMSMEFFTWPWMELFFKEDTDKYKFSHLSGALQFLPYGVAVDEFQHVVYENPHFTPAQRNEAWRAIEQKYLPGRDYAGNAFLESGALWQKQGHIFEVPFYYIDYTLAQICALQFWLRAAQDRSAAWADYVALCKMGGSRSFLDLVRASNLESPFVPGIVGRVCQAAKQWLDAVDDRSF
jgi:M3 family oligoendopeptidase